MTDHSSSAAWRSLEALAREIRQCTVSQAFRENPSRERDLSAQAEGLLLDYSHQRIDARVMDAWASYFDETDLASHTEALFSGAKLNVSEDRPALHAALRQHSGDRVGGESIEQLVLAERERMLQFAEEVRASGRYSHVVNIGIGGSDLGPATVVRALRNIGDRAPEVSFVSNVDGHAMSEVLSRVDPATTLFIVCSKTFTTLETLSNAHRAKDWLVERLGAQAVPQHFVGVSTNGDAMTAFGIPPERQFFIWDWVGGRFSLWSSIGLVAAIALGRRAFEGLLAGARRMDQHFRTARWRENLPALMAALEAWNVNFLGFSAHAVLPYSDRLSLLPFHLQQLEMESNGKSVTSDGAAVGVETSPVIWGAAANDAQHSFFQLLHQGSNVSSMDVILPMTPPEGSVDYDWVLANAVAQIEAFTMGFDNGEPHKRHEGNRSLSLILLDRLSPERLGSLLALYEHKVFVLSRVWQINPFDQFGVELGKVIARQVVQLLGPTSTPEALISSDLKSVRALILQLRAAKDFDR